MRPRVKKSRAARGLFAKLSQKARIGSKFFRKKSGKTGASVVYCIVNFTGRGERRMEKTTHTAKICGQRIVYDRYGGGDLKKSKASHTLLCRRFEKTMPRNRRGRAQLRLDVRQALGESNSSRQRRDNRDRSKRRQRDSYRLLLALSIRRAKSPNERVRSRSRF